MTSSKPLVDLAAGKVFQLQRMQRLYEDAQVELERVSQSARKRVADHGNNIRAELARCLGVASWSVDVWDWECPHSPIGLCVGTPGYYGCRFCGDPQTRK